MIENYKYDQQGFLGAGTFGSVYKAINVKTGEIVALKILDMKMFNDQFMIDSLKNEIKVMQTLTSPNVVRMRECFGTKAQTYMVIELCDTDLRKIMNIRGFIPEDQSVFILRQLMQGFKDLINHNYMHRDIKPENCLVKGNVFKVADFGFATKIDITGRQLLSDCVGTPIYMSPQILNRHPYNAKSDIWSIGMMFYEMLFGKAPWSCRDMNSLLRNIKTQPLRFPYERQVHETVKDFIRRCLVIDEEKRIGWNEIFNHEILKSRDQKKDLQQVLRPGVINIITILQSAVYENQVDPYFIFAKFDKDRNNSLDFQKFTALIMCVDPKTCKEDIVQLFEAIAEKDGKVAFQDFQTLLTLKKSGFNQILNRNKFVRQQSIKSQRQLSLNVIKILRILQNAVQENQVDPYFIFAKFDKDKNNILDFNEFRALILCVDPRTSQKDIIQLFEIVAKKDGKVDFREFQTLFTEFDFCDINDRAGNIIKDIQEVIKANKINIDYIFKHFDRYSQGNLVFQEFKNLIRSFVPGLKDYEIQLIFEKFDRDKNGLISFPEFQYILSRGTGQTQRDDLIKRAQGLLRQLQYIIKTNNLDTAQIFKKFDKSGDNMIDHKEFFDLMRAINQSISRNEAAIVFHFFDKNNDSMISYQEFKQLL